MSRGRVPAVTDLRRQILDASIDMIAAEGVRTVSFREVARRAGVSHQAPYHHFGNYQGILHAIAQEGFGALADAMSDAAEAAEGDSMTALTEAGIAYIRFARDHVGHFRVMFQKTLVDVAEEELEEAQRTHGTLVRLATAAAADGYGGGMDPELLANLCWALVHGFATFLIEGILDAKARLSPQAEDQLARQVVEALDDLLRAKKKKRRRRT